MGNFCSYQFLRCCRRQTDDTNCVVLPVDAMISLDSLCTIHKKSRGDMINILVQRECSNFSAPAWSVRRPPTPPR